MDTKNIYRGIITEGEYGNNRGTLFIGEQDIPISLTFADDFGGDMVTVRYFISEEEKSIENLEENLIKQVIGSVDADYEECYTAVTGYVWTTEEIVVGGHDLLEVLAQNEGKFIHLEVIVHNEQELNDPEKEELNLDFLVDKFIDENIESQHNGGFYDIDVEEIKTNLKKLIKDLIEIAFDQGKNLSKQ